MKIYRAVLKAVSSFTSPLQSDTLFGAFCWAYKYTYGEEKLKKFIKLYKEGKPPIIFSNVFPLDLLPFPMINLLSETDDKDDSKIVKLEKYKNFKKMKKLKYLSIESFNKIINGKGYEVDLKKEQERENQFVEVIRYSNIINRSSDTVMDFDESGGLFVRKEIYPKSKLSLYAKIESGWEDIFVKIIEVVCCLGLGGYKSIGKGMFELHEVSEYNEFSIPNSANGFITLSNYIPAKNDPVEGNYKTIVKYGKLDREYATTDKPFKKPLLMLSGGAVFYADDSREYYGRVVTGISNLNKNIVHSGIAFILPIKICDNGGAADG